MFFRTPVPCTPAMNIAIKDVLSLSSDLASNRASNFPLVDINSIIIEPRDIQTLKPETWLGDNIINSVLHLICQDSPTSFAFPAHFIKSFRMQGYSHVIKTQTKRIDPEDKGELFTKKLVFVPVNPGEVHWTLIAINMELKTITYYDSMDGRNPVI